MRGLRKYWLISLIAFGLAACATDPRRNAWSAQNTPLAVAEYNGLSDVELFQAAESGVTGEAQYVYGPYLYFAAANRSFQTGRAAEAQYWLEQSAQTPLTWRVCQTTVSTSGTVSCASRAQSLNGLPEAQFQLGCMLIRGDAEETAQATVWFPLAARARYAPARAVLSEGDYTSCWGE